MPQAFSKSFQRSSMIAALVILLLAGAPSSNSEAGKNDPIPAKAKPDFRSSYGKLPLAFEANQGQSESRVKFLSRGAGYSLFLTDSAAVLRVAKTGAPADLIGMELAGVSRKSHPQGQSQLPGMANYFIGNNPAQWHRHVPTYAKVKYSDVYPGVDLVYYGNQRQLEYDFVIAPGADPKAIRLRFTGTENLSLAANGDLKIIAAKGEIGFHKPIVYQMLKGRRQPVEGRFTLLAANAVGFALARYDRTRSLVIDPVLTYSTYLGGSNYDAASAIAVDKSGNAYITGFAESANFPITKGALDTVNNAAPNMAAVAFITKINPAGTSLLYSTFLGGAGGASASSIAIDGSGAAYVTGTVSASDFPVTAGAFQSTYKAGNYNPGSNAFVTKLNPAGSALEYSTYLGGSIADFGAGIAVDSLGNAFVTGSANSPDFPVTAGAYQIKNNATNGTAYGANVFITELNPSGKGLVYSTYLGGSGFNDGFVNYGDNGTAIALDEDGNAYVTGYTTSTNFPTTKGVFQTVNNSGNSGDNAFVAKLNATGEDLVFSTYLGGSQSDSGYGIAIDSSGVYVAGQALSDDFPITKGAFQTTNNGAENETSNAFVSKLNPDGTGLLYSTYLGGSGPNGLGDWANAIAVDGSGDAYVTGETISEDFPVTKGAFQTVNNDEANLGTNVFVTKLNPSGSNLLYSTYLGGDGDRGGNGVDDVGSGIALDPSGNAYVTGQAYSTNFPVTSNAFQKVNNSAIPNEGYYANAFVASFALGSSTVTGTATKLASSANPQTFDRAVTFTATVAPTSGTAVPTGNVAFSIDGKSVDAVALSSGKATYATSSLALGTHSVVATYAGTSAFSKSTSSTLTETIVKPVASAPVFTPASGTYSSPQSVKLTDATAGAIVYYTSNGTTPSTASTRYATPIAVSTTETIKAIAVAAGFTNSVVTSATYIIEKVTATPVIAPAAGTYASGKSITIADATADAIIYYTTNGTTPTTASTKYTKAFTITKSETVKAIAVATGYIESAVATTKYTIVSPAATPIFSVPTGSYSDSQKVEISDTTPGATIYYTTNGSTPNPASAVYKSAVSVSASEYLQAIAVADGYTQSKVAIAFYGIGANVTATPVLSPLPGAYGKSQTVTMTDATAGAVITYSIGMGDAVHTYTYTAPFTVSSTEYIAYDAIAPGYTRSASLEGIYTIGTVPTPEFSPAGGKYSTAQVVQIYDITPNATIHYTTNGATPTTGSAVYAGPVIVTANQTLRALAVISGLTSSSEASAAYTIGNGVATPTFSLAPGSYTAAQSVAITDITPGATIYYTTNGATPTKASTKYTGAIKVSATETLKAIALATGDTGSAVATAAYTIGFPIETFVATPSGTDVLTVPAGGSAAFAVATENKSGQSFPSVTVKTSTGKNSSLPVQVTLCQTNTASGQCVGAPGPTVTVAPFAAGATPTFSVFVAATAAIASSPNNEILVLFTDAGGTILGSASVLVVTN